MKSSRSPTWRRSRVWRSFTLLALAAGFLATTAAQEPAPAPAKLDLSPKALVAKASAYVADYTKKLAVIIGEESYIQEVFASEGVRTQSRRMKGELFLTYVPADRGWIAVHDVNEVDGQPVTDRTELTSLIQRGTNMSVIAELAKRNGRFNIGSVARNFNEPTLALLILESSRSAHAEFKREAVETVGPTTLVTLSFKERKNQPTLIRSESGFPIYSSGQIVLEADTGRVRRTSLAFEYASMTGDLTTTYMPDPRLQLWLPSLFAERYVSEASGLKETIVCSARYSNYRRFETSGRIRRQ